MDPLLSLQNDPRVRVRRPGPPDPGGRCIVYWMQRAQRPHDNPALDLAITLGNLLQKPVVVFLAVVPFYPNANARHYHFLAQGLPDLAEELPKRRVGFVLRRYPQHSLAAFCDEVRPALVIGDENPLRQTEGWRQAATRALTVPLWTVDADVVVPSRLFPKEEFAARTLRPKMHKLWDNFLRPSDEPSAAHPWPTDDGLARLAPGPSVLDGMPLSTAARPVSHFVGGYREGQRALQRFLSLRLGQYDERRNHPDQLYTSQLSPYLHFGHIGPRQIALAVRQSSAPQVAKDALLEEMIVRRELAINFVTYNPRYDQFEGFEPWAQKTLREHEADPRPYRLSLEQLANAESPDPLWNTAQRELVKTGWMHGYVRMYWAKRLLEWAPNASEALRVGIELNDRYQLDGRDPNGYTGLAWAIGGKHDRAWGPVRPIFGMVRYMSFDSTSRKFNFKGYQQRVAAS